MNWFLKKFEELSVTELYDILKLRSLVFVVEQTCVFLDMDDKDQKSYHFMGYENGELMAYTRIVPPGISYPEASIGRVVTSPASRGTGLGRMLMEESIKRTISLYGNTPIKIGAQSHLNNFYGSLGFTRSSDIYMEDGIPHIEMTRIN